MANEKKEIRDRVLRTQQVEWKKLKPFQPENLKTMTAESFAILKNNIIESDFITSFYVWQDKEKNYWLLDGHHRMYALDSLEKEGYKIPSTFSGSVIDANNADEAVKILLSYTSSHARLDPMGLNEFITVNNLDWSKLETTLDLPGIDLKALQQENVEVCYPQCDEDEIPELAIEPTTKLGDIWILGNHRLMCSDSTNPLSVEKLFNGAKPNLMVTDPPYGVNYDPEWREGADLGIGKRSKGKVQNDVKIDWTEAYSLFTGDISYVWHAGKYTHTVAKNLEDCDFEIVSQIIWAKQHFVLSRGDYHWQHEPCWYVVKKGKKHDWQGARDQATIWNIKNNNSFGNSEKEETWGHGTQKPVECMLKPILNNSTTGSYIYDPFTGSGTTLIACEKSNRKCLSMEIDPRYCDVIVKRWQKFTGKKAIHEETQKEFDELSPLV